MSGCTVACDAEGEEVVEEVGFAAAGGERG